MGMDKKGVSASFSKAATAQIKELKIFDDFLANMHRAGIPTDRNALTQRLDEVREMTQEARKIETLREFNGAINVGREANSQAELERGVKKLAGELKRHEKIRKDLERMEKRLISHVQGAKPSDHGYRP